jgi:transketolase
MRQTALQTIYEMAKTDERVVFIGSDLGVGTLKEMKAELPDRFFMEGISEQHIVGFAAGLAAEGFIPYINTIGTFLTRRSFEQIAIDVALHNLPVRILASGGGMVYAPLGPTHTAIEDFSLMLSIPNLSVYAPSDANEMVRILTHTLTDLSPAYIRIAKGGEKIVSRVCNDSIHLPQIYGTPKSDVIICTTGIMLQEALETQAELSDYSITVYHFPYLTALSIDSIAQYFTDAKLILSLEEHVPRGGLFTQLLHEFAKLSVSTNHLIQRSLPMNYPHKYGSQREHFDANFLSSGHLTELITTTLS